MSCLTVVEKHWRSKSALTETGTTLHTEAILSFDLHMLRTLKKQANNQTKTQPCHTYTGMFMDLLKVIKGGFSLACCHNETCVTLLPLQKRLQQQHIPKQGWRYLIEASLDDVGFINEAPLQISQAIISEAQGLCLGNFLCVSSLKKERCQVIQILALLSQEIILPALLLEGEGQRESQSHLPASPNTL